MELDPQVSPEEIMSREVELGCESWTSFASGCSSTAVQRTLSLVTLPVLGLGRVTRTMSVCTAVEEQPEAIEVETGIAQCTSRCARARGHRLNTSIVLAAVHGLSGLFRAVSANLYSFVLFPPPPPHPVPVPNKQLASVDVKHNGQVKNRPSNSTTHSPALRFSYTGSAVLSAESAGSDISSSGTVGPLKV